MGLYLIATNLILLLMNSCMTILIVLIYISKVLLYVVKSNVRCLLVIQSALLHLHVYEICMNSVDLKILLSNVIVLKMFFIIIMFTQNDRAICCTF